MRRPFASSDPLELIHAHIARTPRRLRQVDDPRSRSRCPGSSCKLLAKAAEDRYHSALGLAHDLDSAAHRAWHDGIGRSPPSSSAQQRRARSIPDLAKALRPGPRGRGRCSDAFDRDVRGDGPGLLLVSGYSGIGKTSLIHELYKPIVRQRGLLHRRASSIRSSATFRTVR